MAAERQRMIINAVPLLSFTLAEPALPYLDGNDSALRDTYFGTPVTFLYSGSPGIYGRKQVEGVIVDVRTSKRGVRSVQVHVEGLPFDKWVDLNLCQFPQTKTLASVKEVSVS